MRNVRVEAVEGFMAKVGGGKIWAERNPDCRFRFRFECSRLKHNLRRGSKAAGHGGKAAQASPPASGWVGRPLAGASQSASKPAAYEKAERLVVVQFDRFVGCALARNVARQARHLRENPKLYHYRTPAHLAYPRRTTQSPNAARMKTLASFNLPMDAYLLRARLEGSGITAYVRDENLITLDWLYSNAVGGVKVDVMDEDYERALELLNAD